MISSLSIKRSTPIVQKRIDNYTQLFPPLDYSFHNAQKIEGLNRLFLFNICYACLIIDAVSAEPRVASGAPNVVKEGDRYHSHGINLNHNMLSGPLETLPNFIRMTLVDPDALSTLDLSFNTFGEIPAVSNKYHEGFIE
jgi:hypothetical protein